MDPSQTGLLISIIILIFLSAFFGFAETSLSFVNKVRLKTMAEGGNKKASRVIKITDNFDKALSTILVGNNIVNITIASLSTVLFAGLIRNASIAVTLSTVVITIVLLLFAEISPKTLAKEKPETFAMAISRPMQIVIFLLTPINAIFMLWQKLLHKIFRLKNKNIITDDELINYVEAAVGEGGLDEHDSDLIKSAIEFDNLHAYDIMTPRVNVIAIPSNTTITKVAKLFKEHGFSRLPVYQNNIDTIIGIIHVKDFYAQCMIDKKPLKDIFQPLVYSSENMRINDVLRMLQEAKSHMAIVVDEHGGTSGIVTMEDIIEELVGDIYDETDEEQVTLQRIDDTTFIVAGSRDLEDTFESLGLKTDKEFESSTVGGWVTEQLEKIPLPGEEFTFENLHVSVTKADMKSVTEVKIIVEPPESTK